MFKKLRYRWAFKCGHAEHRFSRICFMFIVLTTAFNYLKKYDLATITNWLALICWCIYFLCHITEKKLFPKQRRG